MEHNIIEITNLHKSFDHTEVVKGIDLQVRPGEFLTLLGPSGCGKTTTLRMIAGFEDADCGSITIDGQDVTALPPYKREVNTVFQSYALFPLMNVYDNVAYGLTVKRLPKAEIREKVTQALKTVQLEGFEKRKISQMSGGQKQRVAIARALVNGPKVLLDEPLGALDFKLRKQMQLELKRLQKQLGITFIYVTHDQEEAMTMSDRIAVMRAGEIEQIDTPSAIYNTPPPASWRTSSGNPTFWRPRRTAPLLTASVPTAPPPEGCWPRAPAPPDRRCTCACGLRPSAPPRSPLAASTSPSPSPTTSAPAT